ncbi:MAG: class I SAM-dependent methyltransferase [Bacteroidota bacterium]
MKNEPDIFGLAFADFLKGHTREVILVDTDISEREELPVSYFFRYFDQMPPWEQKVLNACRGKVLDVGAGAGSHALYLQKRGLEVTAVDISPGAVDCMQKRGVKNAVAADFFSLPEEEKMDTILFLMNGAGLAQKLENLPNMLAKASRLLDSRGSIYLESTDLIYMFREEDGSVMIDLAGNYYGEITYHLHYKEFSGKPFPWLFVDFENLCDKAAEVGLECELFFQDQTDNYVARLFKTG